jgi:hypothetical protein
MRCKKIMLFLRKKEDSDPHYRRFVEEIAALLKKVDVNPAVIYAFKKTGLLIDDYNMHFYSSWEIQAWNKAIDDYEADNSLFDLNTLI